MQERSHQDDARSLFDAGILSREEYDVVSERIAEGRPSDPRAWPVPAPEDRIDVIEPSVGPTDPEPPVGPSARSIALLVVLALIGGVLAYLAINSTSSDSTAPGPDPIVRIETVRIE